MLTESQVETQLHDGLSAEAAAITPGDDFMRAALSHHPRQGSTRPLIALGAVPIAACIAVAVWAVMSPSPSAHPAAGARHTTAAPHVGGQPAVLTVKVLGRAVALPTGVRVVSSSGSSCQAWLEATRGGYTWAMPAAVDDAGVEGSASPRGESDVVRVPDGDQGCIQSSISGAYALPPGIIRTSLLVPTRFGGTPTTIDGDYAEIVPIEIGAQGGSSSETQGTLIYVREPADNGEFKLVTIVGWQVPASELVDLTTSALAG
jgi:hypothetical protein